MNSKERRKYLEERIKEEKRLNVSAPGYQQELNAMKKKQFVLSPPKQTFPANKQRINFIQNFNPAPSLSNEQMMLQELMGGGERTFGTGQDLPRMEGVLTSGNGLLKNEDDTKETASMFGFKQAQGGY